MEKIIVAFLESKGIKGFEPLGATDDVISGVDHETGLDYDIIISGDDLELYLSVSEGRTYDVEEAEGIPLSDTVLVTKARLLDGVTFEYCDGEFTVPYAVFLRNSGRQVTRENVLNAYRKQQDITNKIKADKIKEIKR